MLAEDISTRCSYYATGVPTRVTLPTVRHATSVTSREINRGHTFSVRHRGIRVRPRARRGVVQFDKPI